MFETAKAAATFAFAGNATITLKSVKTGTWFTFSIKAPARNPDDVLFVSVLCGADSYRYLGMLDAARNFRTTTKTDRSKDAKAAAAFLFFADALKKDRIPASLEVRHDGRCGCCGRKITTPASLDSGIGPDCAENMGLPISKQVRRTACNHSRCTSPLYDCGDYKIRYLRECVACGEVSNGEVFTPKTREIAAAVERVQNERLAEARRPDALERALDAFALTCR